MPLFQASVDTSVIAFWLVHVDELRFTDAYVQPTSNDKVFAFLESL